MSSELLLILAGGIFVIAVLYSSVGHAGASGYIAVMSLLSVAPSVIKPTALALNILVASITSWQFCRRGHFSWRLFWPFALLGPPLAFVGGYLELPSATFQVLVGVILLYSAVHFVFSSSQESAGKPLPLLPAVVAGAAIGLLSGLTGTGGGIFLTPLLLFLGWAQPRAAAAVSAVFILLNSLFGLLGSISSTRQLPAYLVPLLLAAAAGGLVGSHFGSKRLAPVAIKRFLAVVLLVAGAKMVFL